MSRMHTLRLWPAERWLRVPAGTRLQDALFPQGVEFPCGGHGTCRGCRVKVLQGVLPPGEEERSLLTADELAQGWRLACRHAIAGDLELELAQWEMEVLSDQSTFTFTPRAGLGAAIDLGTTTLAAQLLDLQTGTVLASTTALNGQARHGSDIMSRVEYAVRGGQKELERLIRQQLGKMVEELLSECSAAAGQRRIARAATEELTRVMIVGNTVMHHLFCGVSVTPLAGYPFQPRQPGRFQFSPADLGWDLPRETVVEFLPCLGGFVGSDILAGIVATGLHESREWVALMDLGTNGEVVVGNRERLLCTSTAAGPAFEGARIAMGMRAATGAISGVQVRNGALACHVLGGGAPRGLCGSGLVDAVAAGLDLRRILPNGRMMPDAPLPLAGSVSLSPADVRELQLAKGAIATGLRVLAARFGLEPGGLRRLHLAGAFGNYINRTSAQRIGLLRLPANRIVPAGNSALLGAKRSLFEDTARWDVIRNRVEVVALNEEPAFEEIYTEEMQFPAQ